MLHLGDVRVPVCHGVTRRSFLHAGAAGIGALSMHAMNALEASGAVNESKAKIRNCITIFLVGSPGQVDTWDMKPEAPAEVRGKFKPIDTNVPGIQICEHFPLMARMMDKVALIRSLHHKTGATHENGQRWMMTGHDFNADSMKPHSGSVISRVFGNNGMLPASVLLPWKIGNTGAGPLHGQTAAYLGSAHEPFYLGSDPSRSDFKVADLSPPAGQTELRINTRHNLLKQLDDMQRRAENGPALSRDTAYSRAFNLITSNEAKQAFDLSQEAETTRDRYGRNTLGQSCLMARRLVERGCRYITINHFDTVFGISCWDMHADGNNPNIVKGMNMLGRSLDQAVSAFLDDLEQRGLSDKVLLVITGDFGRTPKVNARGGRDHWANLGTLAFAGGGLNLGQVIGQSDRTAGNPATEPVTLPMLFSTILHTVFDVPQLRLRTGLPREITKFYEQTNPIPGLIT